MVKVDFDREVETAWRAFEHRLAAAMIGLGRRERLEVVLPTTGPSVEAAAMSFTARVSTILFVAAAPVAAGVPRTKQFRVGDEPAIAVWAVAVLRDAYAVLHPAFLGLVERTADGITGLGVAAPSGSVLARMPDTPDELDDLVEATLAAAVVSLPLRRDRDGDIPIVGEGGTAYVRVRRDRPMVEVFALLDQVEDPVAACVEANSRNTRSSVITYYASGPWLCVRAGIWCRPYPGSLLLEVLESVMDLVAGATDDAVEPDDEEPDEQPDDEEPDDEEPDDEEHDAQGLDTAALTIAQLTAEDPGSVSADLAARIYGFDRDHLLAGIRQAQQAVTAWRESIAEARTRDEEEAEVCAIEVTAWESTVSLLRAALRVTVER